MDYTFGEFFFHGSNVAFMVSLFAMLAIGLVELLSSLIGVSISEVIDDALPDIEIGGEAEVAAPGLVFDWLNLGRVPFLVLIVVFLTSYSISGFLLQLLVLGLFSQLLPPVVAALVALIPTIFFTHVTGRGISRILPQTLTTAVSSKSLEGSIAEITIGVARVNLPAEARVEDRFGNPHYVRVVPLDKDAEYPAKTQVVLIELTDGIFSCEKIDSIE